MRKLVLVCIVFVTITTLAEDVVVRPEAKPGPLDNPLKGWCPYPTPDSIHQPYSMVFQYVSWKELEPTRGVYRFEEWEKRWNVGAAIDKHIVFRVYIDYPAKPSGLPDWLRQSGVKETAYTEYGGGKSPNYDDPRMLAAMERLIAALGERYNKNPRIAFIQLGLLGFWGEWHTYPQSKLYASPETERRIIEAYRQAFPDKVMMVRYARDFAGQQKWIGFHDDMFPQDTDNGKDWSFLARMRKTKRTDNWKVAVIGGEMVPGKAKQWLGNGFATTIQMIERSHFTWVGPYCPASRRSPDDSFVKRSEEIVRKMGYEFQIVEVTHPAQVTSRESARLAIKGRNMGVAPFYYPWSVVWVLLDSTGKVVSQQETKWNLCKWLPGVFSEQTQMNFDVPPGTYRLGLGIRDPWKGRPGIRFANNVPIVDGWAVLSTVEVTP